MKNLFNNHKRKLWIIGIMAVIALVCIPFMAGSVAGAMLCVAPLAGFTDDDKALLEKTVKDSHENVRKEFIESIKDVAKKEDITKALAEFTDVELKSIKSQMEKMGLEAADLLSVIKTQGTELSALKEKGLVLQKTASTTPNTFYEKCKSILNGIFKSDDYKEFETKGFVGGTQQYTLGENREVIEKSKYDEVRTKAVGVTADHTGDVLIAEISGNVRDIPVRKTHVRNLMTVRPTQGGSIVAPEVTDYSDAFTMGATTLGENDEAGASAFKTKENTWSVKRIARSLSISKRYFKINGLKWVMNWILSRLPDQIQFVEDFQLLFGDGLGNNVEGLTKDAQTMTLSGSYSAGAIDSIAGYEGTAKTLVKFVAAHGLRNGDNVTFAETTTATYDHTYASVIVMDSKTIVINQAYTADAGVADWTGTWTSFWYHKIDNVQEFDVISVAKALLNAGEYEATGVVLNSADFENLGLIKDLYGAYIGVSRDAMGKVNINAMPIAVTNAIPAGHFLVGDFQRACELAEFTPLTIQISEDTTDKKKNQVTVIAEEEIIFPKYNPKWFMYGKFTDCKTAIEKP